MGSMRLEYWTTELKTSFYSGLAKVDHFLQQHILDELFLDVKKVTSNNDYSRIWKIIDDRMKQEDKSQYTWSEYRALQDKIIMQLELPKTSKLNINIFDENFYSYKLIFWKDIYNSTDTFWSLTKNALKLKTLVYFMF